MLQVAPAFAAIVLLAVLAALIWPKRHESAGTGAYAFVLACQTIWVACWVAELFSSDLPSKMFWDGITYLPAISSVVGTVQFASAYTGRRRLGTAMLVAVIAALGPAALWNATIQVVRGRPDAQILPVAPLGALTYGFTWIDTLVIVGMILGVAFAAGMLLAESWGQSGAQRATGIVLAVGLFGPYVFASVALILGITWLGQRDLAPFQFGLFGLVTAGALLRGAAFDLVHVAREQVIEHLADAVLVLDAESRILDANAQARTLLGIAAADIGKPAPASAAFAALSAALHGAADAAGERTLSFEGMHLNARVSDVSNVRSKGRARAIVLHDVSTLHAANVALGAARDDLEQRVTERTAAVLERERTVRAIFQHSVQLMALLTPDGRVLGANPAALRLVGLDAEAVEGRFFWETPWWTHDAALAAQLREGIRTAQGGAVFKMVATHKDADGQLHDVDFALSPVPDGSGGVAQLIAEGRDVTEFRQGERERRALSQQVQHLQRVESLGRIASALAHDFNNFLTVIVGNASIAQRACEPKSRASNALDQVLHASHSAADLAQQLLTIGRERAVGKGPVDVQTALERLRGLLVPVLGENVALQISCAPGAGEAAIDPGQFEQVLVNLAINARDAMPGGGTLTIAAEPAELDESSAQAWALAPGAYVVIRVEDTGSGMTEQVKARAFEPFFTTKGEGAGTGLGLAIVFGIVRSVRGYVDLESAPNQGTRFSLHLPRAAPAVSRASTDAGSVLPKGQGRILVVEDRADICAFMHRVLSECGYDVALSPGGSEALQALTRGPLPDLLISDVRMPGMSGPALAREARRCHPGLPVLFISGHADGSAELDGERLLAKPFTPQKLAHTVNEMLAHARRAAASEKTRSSAQGVSR